MNYITIKSPIGYTRISVDEISYFKSVNGLTRMCKKDGCSCPVSNSLKDLEQDLKAMHFIRIHSNCLLNINQEFAFLLKTRTIQLAHEAELIVARERLTEVRKRLTNHSDKYLIIS